MREGTGSLRAEAGDVERGWVRGERHERVAGLSQPGERRHPVGHVREGCDERGAHGGADRLPVQGVCAARREEDRVGAEGPRVPEDAAHVVGIRDVLERQDEARARSAHERLEGWLDPALAQRDAAAVEVEAHDGAGDLVARQIDGGVRGLQRLAEAVERRRGQQDRASAEARRGEQAAHHGPTLGHEEPVPQA